jgi:aminoglycoside 3-N-acetyltransferase
MPGDHVLVHAALRRVGRVLGGADAILDALRIAVGPKGTVLGYTDWDGQDDVEAYPDLRDDAPVFDPLASRAIRENGFFPEMLRTTPGARRSGNPGASMAAIGARAEWFTADHALDYGYGPASPLGKLVEAGGKTLMLGAPLDTMTLLHHAEHLADFSPKRIRHYVTPMREGDRTVWRHFEEFDTTEPPEGLPDDYFAAIVADFLRTGRGARGRVGEASSVLVAAKEIVPFAVEWIERRLRSAS